MTSDVSDLQAGQTIDVDGVATHYHDAGDGPPVLLLHGSGPGVSAWSNWRLVLPELAKRFRVVAPDQIGFAGTKAPGDVQFGRETWTRHALRLMDTLGLERYDVIGNSMGGAIALSMTVSRPQAIRYLVLMGTMGVPMPLPSGLSQVWSYDPSGGREGMRQLIGLFAYDKSLMDDEQLVEGRYQATTEPDSAASWAAMFEPPQQRWVDDLSLSYSELAAIEQPILMVHGYNDPVVPFKETSLRLMDVFQDARMYVLGRCGHWAMLEHTDPFNRVVGDFLEHGS
jgi:pimeloyl-ACP methyl ester carboxylesterase